MRLSLFTLDMDCHVHWGEKYIYCYVSLSISPLKINFPSLHPQVHIISNSGQSCKMGHMHKNSLLSKISIGESHYVTHPECKEEPTKGNSLALEQKTGSWASLSSFF